jgi:DNA helicase-2/ATP-dependent DNA helicase PcrA
MEEERRLCYVGMTRAKEQLYLVRAARRIGWGGLVSNPKSRFLDELPDHLIDEI